MREEVHGWQRHTVPTIFMAMKLSRGGSENSGKEEEIVLDPS